MRISSPILFGTMLMLFLAAECKATVPQFVRSADWTEVRTTHLVVLTDGGAGLGWDVARRLERFARALDAINPYLSTHVAIPMTILVFRDQKELESYKPGQSENLVAYFLPNLEQQYLVLNGQPEGIARAEVVFHEFVHAYLHGNFPAVPLWLDEGLAEYYSTCKLSSGGAEFGIPNQDIVEWLKGKPLVDMSLMFAMKPGAGAYQSDNGLRTTFYAQSYALVHYLSSQKDDRAGRFGKFLAKLQKGAVSMTAFAEFFPRETWPAMIAALPSYLAQMDFEPARRVRMGDAGTDDDRGERAVGLAEVLVRLGELELALGAEDSKLATEHFEQALEADPHSAGAHAGLALVSVKAGRAEDAEKRFAEALRLAPGDARIWNAAARGAMLRAIDGSDAQGALDSTQQLCRLARERYRKSLQLAPDNLDALGGYGMTFAVAGQPGDSLALSGLTRAVELQPGRPDLAAALAALQVQRGPSEAARALVKSRIEPAAGHGAASDVLAMIGATELVRADSLANAGRYAAAESVLTQILRSDPGSEVRQAAIESLDRIRGAHAGKAWADSFNAAITLARNKQLEEARAAFERASSSAQTDEQREMAESARRHVEADLRFKRVQQLVSEGKLAAAEQLLSDPTFVWPDAEYAKRTQQVLATVRARREIERALALVKAGKLVEARAVFERVAAMDVGDEMKKYARDRVRQLESATK